MLTQLPDIGQRFRAISAFMNVSSPEKIRWKCQVKSDLKDNKQKHTHLHEKKEWG